MDNNESVIVISNKNELIRNGYIYSNVNKEFIYQGMSFLLKKPGMKTLPSISMLGYSPHKPKLISQNPIWVLKLHGITMDIHKLY